jgi:hypothetical protein
MSCQYNFTTFSVTGDCENNGSGGFTLYLETSSEPMSITWYEPNPWPPPPYGGPTTETDIYNGTREYLGLPAGTYVFTINDSCGGIGNITENNRETINITVSSGSSCVNIDGVISTTCGSDNGIITATTQNINGTATFVLYKDGIPIETAFTDNTFYIFTDLEPGTYYVNADNGGGCTGNSETALVLSSTPINYGFYVVNDADCGNVSTGVGKLFITGLTGVGPYNYQWEQVNSNFLIDTGQSLTGTSITGLTSGVYSVTVTDSQGCERTQSAEIIEILSVSIAQVTPTPPTCFDENGKITITVVNGTPPYRYYIPSRSFIDISYSQTYTFSGLPGGFYEIIVTDSALCQTSTNVQLNQPDSFSIGSINITNPKCGNSDGQISISLIGDPNKSYTYTLLSSTINTQNISTTSNIFTGLPPDGYLLTITSTNPLTPYSVSFDVSIWGTTNQSLTLTDSNATTYTFNNPLGGDQTNFVTLLQAWLLTQPFEITATLVNNTLTISTNDPLFIQVPFNTNGSVDLTTCQGTGCVEVNEVFDLQTCTYSQNITLTSQSPYTVSLSATGTTCGNQNGSVKIEASSGGTGLYTFSIIDINGNNNQTATNTGTSSFTFNNLAATSYIATVEDQSGCEVNDFFNITPSEFVNFFLTPTTSTNGSNGQILASITNGKAPFTLFWSSNVNGQTGTTVQNLSAGTYSLIVQDADGCITERYAKVDGISQLSSSQLYNICNSQITYDGLLQTRTMVRMLSEGYLDLTSGCTDCQLVSAIFSAVTNVAGTGYSQSFYTATTLFDFPSYESWANTITGLLSGATGIGDVLVDIPNNNITLETDCEEFNNTLANQNIIIQLKIIYDINCVSC